VTVYHTDDEAFDLWKKIAGLPDEQDHPHSDPDNFWAMGDTGPCGPCSEIFYDHGDHIPGAAPGSPDEDGDRFIEIWNLVFMQFEQVTPDERVDLPRRRSTPAWGWSASRRCCRARTTITRSTCSAR
jgi:alanyl-tRNA synthetase